MYRPGMSYAMGINKSMALLLVVLCMGCAIDEEYDIDTEIHGAAQQGGDRPRLDLIVIPTETTPLCFQEKDCPTP